MFALQFLSKNMTQNAPLAGQDGNISAEIN